MRDEVGIFDRVYREVENIYPEAKSKAKFYEALKRMLDHFAGDLISNTRKRIRAAGVHSFWAVREFPQRLAAFSDSVEAECKEAKAFLHKSLYDSPELREHKQKLANVVTDLFGFWMQNPDQLPARSEEHTSELQSPC